MVGERSGLRLVDPTLAFRLASLRSSSPETVDRHRPCQAIAMSGIRTTILRRLGFAEVNQSGPHK
jgi:hypothetical protein